MESPKTRLLVCLLFIVILAGCSNRQMYNSIAINRMHNCIPMEETLRDLCLQKYKMTYDEYERLRQEALSADDPDIALTTPLR